MRVLRALSTTAIAFTAVIIGVISPAAASPAVGQIQMGSRSVRATPDDIGIQARTLLVANYRTISSQNGQYTIRWGAQIWGELGPNGCRLWARLLMDRGPSTAFAYLDSVRLAGGGNSGGPISGSLGSDGGIELWTRTDALETTVNGKDYRAETTARVRWPGTSSPGPQGAHNSVTRRISKDCHVH